MFILLSLVACALAEPPVGDSYAAARSSHAHQGFDAQRSLSQDYGAPAVEARSGYASNEVSSKFSYDHSRSAPSQQYGPPEFRSLSQEYGVPNARTGISQEYGPPNNARSNLQQYKSPNTRTGISQDYTSANARSGVSQEYGPPNARSSLSQEYGPPNARSGLSEEYGVPSYKSGLSQEYGLPNSRGLSQQYGPPSLRNTEIDYTPSQGYSVSSARFSPQSRTGSGAQNYKTDIPSDSYGTPLQSQAGAPSEQYGVPSQRNLEQSLSQKYGPPSFRSGQSYNQGHASSRFNKGSASSRTFQSSFGSRIPSQTSRSASYSAPSARNTDSYSPASRSISASYLPSSRGVTDTYAAPGGRSLSPEYNAPDAGYNTNAYASSFDTARSIVPSSKYGPPSARDAMPSQQYGVPEQYDALSSQGYSYARNALDELLNQEPASYDFGYKVSDYISGSDFGHSETRQENKTEGTYFVVLPDGTKQVVEYEADERGFKPRISVEPAESRSGYDDNAADLARSADGPY